MTKGEQEEEEEEEEKPKVREEEPLTLTLSRRASGRGGGRAKKSATKDKRMRVSREMRDVSRTGRRREIHETADCATLNPRSMSERSNV